MLDLRNNPGGLLNSAVDVCGQFLPPHTMVVYTEGRTPSTRREYRTSAPARSRGDFPVAVLINGGSASGAEIVAGALKDLNRAILVGETTFGKGSVQSVISLPDGSAVRLTTAKYFTPEQAGDPPARRHADDPRDAHAGPGTRPHGPAQQRRAARPATKASATTATRATRSSNAPSTRSRA